MSASFELSGAETVTVGTVGEPGHRTFFLQGRQEDQLVTLKIEKQQVAALGELLTELLSDLPAAVEAGTTEAPALEEPALAEWAVGTIQMAYDSSADRVILLAEEVAADPPDGDEGVARLSITRAQAAALVRRAEELVGSGRPACPLCGYPMDPAGHSCPRTNGHRAPTL